MRTRTCNVNLHDREKTARAIDAAAKAIRLGHVIVFPTETSYGLGADATNEKAVAKVFKLKGRDPEKGLPVVVGDIFTMREYARMDPVAEKLAHAFMPGPLTLVTEKKAGMLPDAVSKTGIAIRIPGGDIARAICSAAGKPITATSANLSGESSIYDAEEVKAQFYGKVRLLVLCGNLGDRPASTMVDVRVDPPKLLREGPVPYKEILATLGQKV